MKQPPSKKEPIQAFLTEYPAKAWEIFDVLEHATVLNAACIYGGALRDTDCKHFYGRQNITVKDYDMRVWLPESHFPEAIDIVRDQFVHQGATVKELTFWPDDIKKQKPRCEILFNDCIIDMSFRAKPNDLFFENKNVSAEVAKDRASNSDCGLSAIAIDDQHRVWILPQYREDRSNLTLTLFPSDHNERAINYAKSLQTRKYPRHTIIGPI